MYQPTNFQYQHTYTILSLCCNIYNKLCNVRPSVLQSDHVHVNETNCTYPGAIASSPCDVASTQVSADRHLLLMVQTCKPSQTEGVNVCNVSNNDYDPSYAYYSSTIK